MRRFIGIAFAVGLTFVGSAAAQNFPTRPVTIVVPFPAGGPTDTISRLMAEGMRKSLGQPVIVENQGGAGGSLAVDRVANAAPDGYTIQVGNWTSHVGSGAIYHMQHDPVKDLQPISLLAFAPLLIVGRASIPAKTPAELIAWLKANADKATAGTVGAGSAAQLCLIFFRDKTGTNFQFVPYKGAAPALQDMIANQIDISCLDGSTSMPLARANKITVFAVMSPERWSGAPDVPTMDEAGASGAHIVFWHGLWAPKGTPKDVVSRLNSAVVDTLADPAMQKRFSDIGQVVATRDQQTPEALAAFHKSEIEKWWPIIKAAGIKSE
jgi:tripartite-type tricarboxylate transporter receptor subunit TctC